MYKFHADVYMPIQIDQRARRMLLDLKGTYRLTTHAAERVAAKRVHLPFILPLDSLHVVEVTVDNRGRVEKCLIRFAQDATYDIVMSVTSTGVVPTAWLNHCDDTHKTLDANLYSTPDKLR